MAVHADARHRGGPWEPDPERRKVEIGYTWLGRPWWRTAVNTEAVIFSIVDDEWPAVRARLEAALATSAAS